MPAPPRLKILQVMRAPVGGLFRHVADLTRELDARGHEVGVIVDSDKSDAATEGKLATLAPHAALGLHRLPIPRLFGPADLSTPLSIRALAKRLGVQVLHGHGAKGGFAARLARVGNPGAVALYTPHGGVLHYSPSSPAGKLFRLVERGLLRQTDAMIFESAFAQRAFSAQIFAPTCLTQVIHNGLAPAEFEPVALPANARDFVFVGELRGLKGWRHLLEALVDVRAPDGRPATLIMAGDGPDRADVEAQVAALGLEDRVTLAGVQPARNMFALGRCAVVPSLAESLPYIILEAASAGRPVISTDVGGIPEIFGPTAERLLPAGNTAALQGAMQAFLDDPQAAGREMQTRLDYIKSGFSLDHMVNQIETLYYNVLSRR
jgi:glycosyltransferase involved in cell wall biosynthesis